MPERYNKAASDRFQHALIWAPAVLIWGIFALFALPAMSAAAAQTAPEPVVTDNTVRRTVTRTVRRIEADGTETILTEPVTDAPASSTYMRPAGSTSIYTAPVTTQTTTGSSTRYSSPSETPSSTTSTSTTTTRTYTRYPDTSSTMQQDVGATTTYRPTTTTRTYTSQPQPSGESSGTNSGTSYRSDTVTSATPVRPYTRSVTTTPTEPTPVRTYTYENNAPAPTEATTPDTVQSAAVRRTEVAPTTSAVMPREERAPEPTIISPTVTDSAPEILPIQPENIQPRVAPRTPALTRNRLAPTSYDVPDIGEVHQILWSTLLVINEAQATGDYSRFMLILSPRMRSEVSAAVLPEHMRSLEPHRAELLASVGQDPEFEIPPHLIADGRMRLRGAFRLSEGGVRFDLMYQEVNGTWLVDAIAFAELR
ncbi:hypothetical protein [Ponticaulis koreensis]|uniref:hypothetical protein n=1 Tax=Ponticaulis koreensis TaxID=1123045 RepID=UPI0003B327E8|nr:hypothetical protein [Ponticaulis koreensis]